MMNKFPLHWIITGLAIFFYSCQTEKSQEELKINEGPWLMELQLNSDKLPVNLNIDKSGNLYQFHFLNGREKIMVDDIRRVRDSLYFKMPVFDSEFALAIQNPSLISGVWINNYKSADYKIPVQISHEVTERFKDATSQKEKILGEKYRIIFSPKSEKPGPAIGLFEEVNGRVYGTFATETGDYRHLEGILRNDSLLLSTFDGSHAFLFKARVYDDSLSGVFYSGTHWEENWLGKKDSSAKLRDPDSLTFLKPGFHNIDFSFPNLEGKQVSLSDKAFKDKVLIIQIMGSWCPNCLDETRYLSSLYEKYNPDGLEVIALAFERSRTKEKALENLMRLKEKTQLPYTLLLAGSKREESAEKALPMLNHIMSYPTAIFLDRSGEIRKIHTGFYGPGTGEYYQEFTEKTEKFIQQLLQE